MGRGDDGGLADAVTLLDREVDLLAVLTRLELKREVIIGAHGAAKGRAPDKVVDTAGLGILHRRVVQRHRLSHSCVEIAHKRDVGSAGALNTVRGLAAGRSIVKVDKEACKKIK